MTHNYRKLPYPKRQNMIDKAYLQGVLLDEVVHLGGAEKKPWVT
jgi:hypothetical protein